MAIFWVLWIERDLKIFENIVMEDYMFLWDRVKFWASLGTSIWPEFEDFLLSFD